jgi:hypothetical protein
VTRFTFRIGGIFGAPLAIAGALVAMAACKSELPPSIDQDQGVMGESMEPVPPGAMTAFGCDDPFIICVNACTGRLIKPNVAPLIAEDQDFTIRTVGWGTCQPEKIECTGHLVGSVDVSSPAAPPLPDAGSLPQDTNMLVGQALKAESPTSPLATTVAAGALYQADVNATISDDVKIALKTAQDATADNDGLGVLRLLSAYALNKTAATKASKDPSNTKVGSCADAYAAAVKTVQNTQAALDVAADSARKLMSPYGGTLTNSIATADTALQNYMSAIGGPQVAANVCPTLNPPTVLALARATRAALRGVQRNAERATKSATFAASGRLLANFGDCVMTIPRDITVRQLAVDVKITPKDRCLTEPSDPSCPPPRDDDAGPPADGGAPPRATRDALVYVNVNHGKYYYDVGVLGAAIPMGNRTVSTPETPGVSGGHEIAVSEHAATTLAIAVNLYPLGHRREAFSFLENRRLSLHGLSDALGLQVAVKPDTSSPAVFGGIILEPITGVSFNLGLVGLKGDLLAGGYRPGMAAPANRSDYVESSLLLRFYFGLTVGYELLHTTAAQVPGINQDITSVEAQ